MGPCQFRGFIFSQMELHASFDHPIVNRIGFRIRSAQGFGVERRLTQSLLKNAAGVQRVVGDNSIEHAHTPFIEDAHDGFVAPELFGQLFA